MACRLAGPPLLSASAAAAAAGALPACCLRCGWAGFCGPRLKAVAGLAEAALLLGEAPAVATWPSCLVVRRLSPPVVVVARGLAAGAVRTCGRGNTAP